ncbi:unnamed protein product [Penicillium salamii]|uniref:Uncharacterized protein n=1 Tax=Penicillium salamii TaxID=1612424 RepID=A0A9W4NIK2_9EURO|nr:unnamed protein product [Penicillium salamii]CAG8126992.1 unnamed protein product [Penicillium salamii]CAG8222098.1 unnamed protein product [Penicillium salamii]CAG8325911.1 unnamed protein product [Penicillium salamii]CAG8372730.1 unnamed protein product [Penicillium salamii]
MSFKYTSAEGSNRPRPIYDNEEDKIAGIAPSGPVFQNLSLSKFPPATPLPAPWPITHLSPRHSRPLLDSVLMFSERNGDEFFDQGNYPRAIQFYTQALVREPRAPAHYISRSVAYARLKPEDGGPNYQAALDDAEAALSIAAERGTREYVLSANFRRAISLFQLGRLGDAAFLFTELAQSIKNEQFPPSVDAQNSYRSQILSWAIKLEDMKAKDTVGGPRWDVTVGFFPKNAFVPSLDELKIQLGAAQTGVLLPTRKPEDKSAKPNYPVVESYFKNIDDEMPNAIRHDWFQTVEVATVTFYARSFSFRDVEVVVKILKDEASVALPIPGGDNFNMVMPLFGEINPEKSSYVTKAHKLEVKLHKVQPARWKELLRDSKPGETPDMQERGFKWKNPKPLDAYKDGNQVPTPKRAKEQAKEKQKEKPKVYVTAEDSDSDHGDDVDGFFKKLYAGADPETRRAMVKSFMESQGTSLSTNWEDVSKGKVEPRQ